MKATIWNAGVGKEIEIKNEIGIEFKTVMPIVQLKGWHIKGIGRAFSWWQKDDGIAILVSRDISNKMLHGAEPIGIIDSFPDKKRTDGSVIYKFIPLFEISMICYPKGI